MWWGYLHRNEKVQIKRWFGDHRDYNDDCYNNDFVVKVIAPFEAETYEDASEIIIDKLNKNLIHIPIEKCQHYESFRI